MWQNMEPVKPNPWVKIIAAIFAICAVAILIGVIATWSEESAKSNRPGDDRVWAGVPTHQITHVDWVGYRYSFTLDDSSRIVSGPMYPLVDDNLASRSAAIQYLDNEGVREFRFLDKEGRLIRQINVVNDELRHIPLRY